MTDTTPDQPPEVDETADPGQPGSLPPASAAATRVVAFVSWYGDGLVEPVVAPQYEDETQPPLYARDLESLTRAAEEVERLAAWKAEASEVMLGLQDLGRALGVPLGTRITGQGAAERAQELVTENQRLRDTIQAVERLAQHLVSESLLPDWLNHKVECALAAESGDKCTDPAVAVRWEYGFADEICERHVAFARKRGATVVYPKRHDGTLGVSGE